MAIKFHDGSQAGGFHGYRVTCGTGELQNFRQRWFSIRQFGKARAQQLAQQCSDEWEAEKAVVKARRRTLQNHIPTWKPNYVAHGFILQITTKYKPLADGSPRHYLSPEFRVATVEADGYGAVRVPISRYGYDGAFERALAAFAAEHRLTPAQVRKVRKGKPDKALMADYFAKRLRARGIPTRKPALLNRFNAPGSEGQ